MANINAAFGFRAVKHLNGSPYNGQVREYFIPSTDSTAVYIGDVVKIAGSADANGTATVAVVSATTDIPVGVVVGFRPDPTNLMNKYRVASTDRYVLVADSPDLIFEVQANGASGIAAADVGLNASWVAASGSTTTGVSGYMLDSSTVATTNTLALKVMGVIHRPDNAIGQYDKVLVMFNRHQYANQVAGT